MLSDLVHSMGASNAHNDIKMVPETWCHNALDSTRWGDGHIELSHCRAQQVTWLCWEVRTLLHQGKCHSNVGNGAERSLQGNPPSTLYIRRLKLYRTQATLTHPGKLPGEMTQPPAPFPVSLLQCLTLLTIRKFSSKSKTPLL